MPTNSLADWLCVYAAASPPPSFSSLVTTTTTNTHISPSPRACTACSATLFPLRLNAFSLSQRKILFRGFLSMSLNHLGPTSPVNESKPIQLNEESDFYQLLSPEGLISICGFGSLLSGTSNYHHYHWFFLFFPFSS